MQHRAEQIKTSPRRVVICSELYPVEASRGTRTPTFAVRELVERAIELGFEVPEVVRLRPMFTRRGVALPGKHVVNQVVVHDVPRVGFRFIYSSFLTQIAGKVAGLNGSAPHRAICHMASQMHAAYRLWGSSGTRFTYVFHQSDLKSPQFKNVVKRAEIVLARSPAMALQARTLHDVEVDGIVVSGTDEEIAAFRPRVVQVPVRLVTACLMVKLKNLDLVLRALAVLKEQGFEFVFDVYGDGPEYRPLLELRNRLSLQNEVRFHGFVARPIVIQAMRSSDLFVMPSAPETFGLAYLEAMAAGCVVLGHRNNGIDGIVAHGVDGILAADSSEPAVREALLFYFNSDRDALHRNALVTVRKYTLEYAAANYAAMTRWAE